MFEQPECYIDYLDSLESTNLTKLLEEINLQKDTDNYEWLMQHYFNYNFDIPWEWKDHSNDEF